MGVKLGKMVNKVFFTILSIISLYGFSEPLKDPLKLDKLHASPLRDAYVITFNGTENNFVFEKISIERPKERILKKMKFLSDEDKYAIKVFGNDKYMYTIGIGNPFYANYQHIGYEDREYMGGPVGSAKIEIAIPLNIKPSSFIITKRDSTGKFRDLQEISIQL